MGDQDPNAGKVRCRQIAVADIDAVATLLASGFAPRPKSYFLDGMNRQTLRASPEGFPRYGYLLEVNNEIVGAVLLIFSARPGGSLRCSIASWYVEPRYRAHGAMLSHIALRHKQATYLNVTPAPTTWQICETQGYKRWCGGLFVSFPALSRACADASVVPIDRPSITVSGLADTELALLSDQATYGAISLAVEGPEGASPFAFLPYRIRSGRIPLPAAQLIYCRSIDDYVRHAGVLGRALLTRGIASVFVDANAPITGLTGFYTEKRGRKYYKGPAPQGIGDLADTELIVFGP